MAVPLPIIGLLVWLRGRWAGVRFDLIERRQRIGRGGARFEQHPSQPSHRLLILGDSTVYGIGAAAPDVSLPGWLGRAFPQADITNRSRNGARFRDLLDLYADVSDRTFDVIVVLAGGNDVVIGTPPEQLERDLKRLVIRLQSNANTIVLVNQGNLGNVPLLFDWLRPVFTRRSQQVYAIMKQVSRELPTGWVDFFVEETRDHWHLDPDRYYSADWFHPSGQGYREWAGLIAQTLRSTLQ